jgi:hypothetical protein
MALTPDLAALVAGLLIADFAGFLAGTLVGSSICMPSVPAPQVARLARRCKARIATWFRGRSA